MEGYRGYPANIAYAYKITKRCCYIKFCEPDIECVMRINSIQPLNDGNNVKLYLEYFGASHLRNSVTLTHQIDSYLALGYSAFRSTHASFPIYVQTCIEALVVVTALCWPHKYTCSQQRSQYVHPEINLNGLLSITSCNLGSTNYCNGRQAHWCYFARAVIRNCFVTL